MYGVLRKRSHADGLHFLWRHSQLSRGEIFRKACWLGVEHVTQYGRKVPAHRVVNRNGMLSGKMHFGTPTLMEELLLKEKTMVKENKVVDFEKKFWDPGKELSL